MARQLVTRRRLLKGTGVAVAALSSPFVSRADADSKALTIVQWSHFVPAFDKWFDAFAHDWGTKSGKISTIGTQIGYNADDKIWLAYPDYYINNPGFYRKDLWDEIGMIPETWDDVRIGGAKLKKKGRPVGLSLAHSNDPNLA